LGNLLPNLSPLGGGKQHVPGARKKKPFKKGSAGGEMTNYCRRGSPMSGELPGVSHSMGKIEECGRGYPPKSDRDTQSGRRMSGGGLCGRGKKKGNRRK